MEHAPQQITTIDRRYMFRRLAGALLLMCIIICAGTLAYRIVEGWDFLDSLYMTVITVTTIGFSEVHPLSHAGRVITICVALSGVGTAAYTFSLLATTLLSGELLRLMRGRQMQKDIEKLKDHVVLCGCGRTGSCALKELHATGETVVVIERDAQICEDLAARGIPVICDDATLEQVLEKARVHQAKGLITALPDDADNVFVTLTAREMSPLLCVIARASHKHHESKLRRAGATRIVFVNEVAGRHMANILRTPLAIRFVDKITGMNNREVGLSEVHVTAACEWKGKTLAEAQIRAKTALNVMGIRHSNDEMVVNPGAEVLMGEGDVLIVFGPLKVAEELNEKFTAAQ